MKLVNNWILGFKMTYYGPIEWEGLQEEYNTDLPLKSTFLPHGTKKMRIFRDTHYNIKGEITGEYNDIKELRELELIGSRGFGERFIKLKDIWIEEIFPYPESRRVVKYEFTNFIGSMGIKHGFNGGTFNFSLSASSVKRIFGLPKNSPKMAWLTEWFLNGPKNYIYLSNTTNTLTKKYERKRDMTLYNPNVTLSQEILDNIKEDNLSFESWSQGGVSHLFVEYQHEGEERFFIIHSVKDIFGPSWSKNIGIEYRSKWGIPDHEERRKINEIVNFIIGRRLIKIGWTKFNKDGQIIEDKVFNPGIPSNINIFNLCKRGDEPPVNFIDPYVKTNILILFNELIPPFLESYAELNLDEVLWRYWLSDLLPPYAKLVSLAGSFELLVDSWYKSTKSKTHTKFLPKNKFKRLSNEIKALNKAIEKLECTDEYECENFENNKKKIINKVSQLNNMGSKASIENFFNEIGLKIDTIEKKAIEYRNIPAHGTIVDSDGFKAIYEYEYAYKTLLNRAILKILDFDGEYIDYYNLEKPERHIDLPIFVKHKKQHH